MSNALACHETETTCLAMRPREAAKALGVSERVLWKWTRQGIVPCVRLGKVVLYPTDALRRWLDEQAKATVTLTTADAGVGGEE